MKGIAMAKQTIEENLEPITSRSDFEVFVKGTDQHGPPEIFNGLLGLPVSTQPSQHRNPVELFQTMLLSKHAEEPISNGQFVFPFEWAKTGERRQKMKRRR